jgi:hypothetical protein
MMGVVLALGWSAAAWAAGIRMDPDGFTQDALQQLRAQATAGAAAATGPLSLTLTGPDKKVFQISLDRIYDYCKRVPDDCATQLTTFIKATTHFADPPVAPDPAQLRAVLRSRDYALGVRTTVPNKPADFFLARPFVGDLYEMCVFDLPDTAALVNVDMLKRMNLTPEAAFARCEANIAKAEQIPAEAAQLAPDRGDVIGGDYYVSSLMLLHDAWAPLAARFGGKLLLGVPDSNTVLYANGDDARNVAAMAQAVQEGVRLAQRALSAQVFRWTPTGWEPVSP